MKTTWKNVALVVLLGAGVVGTAFTAVSGSRKTPTSNSGIASMSETSMVSMQADACSCEKGRRSDHSNCALGNCPESNHGMSMVSDSLPSGQYSNGDQSLCTSDRCTPSEAMMKMIDASVTNSETMSMVPMMDAKMSEEKMAPAMPSKMSDKSMAPTMKSEAMDGKKEVMVDPMM